MIDVTYGIVEEIYVLGEDRRVSYGIVAYSNVKTDSTATIVTSVRDVSSDQSLVQNLVDSCNRLSLSTYHLMDVICDFLAG